MLTERKLVAALAIALALSGCENGMQSLNKTAQASTFGEANRQTIAAQIIDPDPQYEYLDPATSGDHAQQAVERYRKDNVKKPERTSTSAGSGSGK